MRYGKRSAVPAFICLSLLFPSVSGRARAQDPPAIIISEVRIGETDSPLNEFMELYNRSEETVDISGWNLRKRTSSGTVSAVASIDECVFLPPKKRFLWAHGKGRFAEDADKTTGASAGFLSKSNTFEITDRNGIVRDSLAWGDIQNDNKSAERNLETLEPTFVSDPSPTGNEYVCRKDSSGTSIASEDAPAPQATTVRINELLPNPSDSEEFIELFNFGNADIDLKGWSLHDASKNGGYTFENNLILKAQSYLALFREEFSFALNNKNETVTLSDPLKNATDTATYASSGKDASYGLSPTGWQWSGTPTPGSANAFEPLPTLKTDIPKRIYRDIPSEFKVRNADEGLRYTWDFGDGHRSRLAEAEHTYSKTGSFDIVLTATGGVEDIVRNFSVEVKKLPKAKLSIVEINPDPQGTDGGNEWIAVRNDGNRTIDLSGWSVASGTNEKTLANHPLNESLSVEPKEEIRITDDMSSFTLPNKGGIVELRRPDRKAADKLRYARPESVQEGAVYRLSDDRSWSWIRSETGAGETGQETLSTDENAETTQEDVDTGATTENIDATNTIIDTIDKLSLDELEILKDQIEAKMSMLATGENGTDTMLEPYGNREIFPRNTAFTVTADSSLLSKEPLVSREPSERNTEMIRYLNRTVSRFLGSFRNADRKP